MSMLLQNQRKQLILIAFELSEVYPSRFQTISQPFYSESLRYDSLLYTPRNVLVDHHVSVIQRFLKFPLCESRAVAYVTIQRS